MSAGGKPISVSVRDVRTGKEVEFAAHAEEAVLSLFPRLREELELRPSAELVLSLGEIQLDSNETFATNGVEEDGKLLLSYEDEGCDIRIFGDRSVSALLSVCFCVATAARRQAGGEGRFESRFSVVRASDTLARSQGL